MEVGTQDSLSSNIVADVFGCSRLFGADEQRTPATRKALRTEVIDPEIAEHVDLRGWSGLYSQSQAGFRLPLAIPWLASGWSLLCYL